MDFQGSPPTQIFNLLVFQKIEIVLQTVFLSGCSGISHPAEMVSQWDFGQEVGLCSFSVTLGQVCDPPHPLVWQK